MLRHCVCAQVAYIITKYGYLHIFDIHSAELIYMNRISADTVFTTVPASHGSPSTTSGAAWMVSCTSAGVCVCVQVLTSAMVTGGIVGLNKSGQVLSVRLNEDAIVSYIALKLDKPRLVRALDRVTTQQRSYALELIYFSLCFFLFSFLVVQASRFAARNGWALTHLPRQLDQLIRQGQYTDAATLIFRTPLSALRRVAFVVCVSCTCAGFALTVCRVGPNRVPERGPAHARKPAEVPQRAVHAGPDDARHAVLQLRADQGQAQPIRDPRTRPRRYLPSFQLCLAIV